MIIASDMGGQSAEEAGLADWREWPQLPAARAGNLFLLDADLLSRQGPRILDGVERLCVQLEAARSKAPTIRFSPTGFWSKSWSATALQHYVIGSLIWVRYTRCLGVSVHA